MDATVFLENREKSLEKALDIEAAEKLNQLITEISEEEYCAGWMTGIEFELWQRLSSDQELNILAIEAGGWWYWDEEKDQDLFCTLNEWKEILKNRGRKL